MITVCVITVEGTVCYFNCAVCEGIYASDKTINGLFLYLKNNVCDPACNLLEIIHNPALCTLGEKLEKEHRWPKEIRSLISSK